MKSQAKETKDELAPWSARVVAFFIDALPFLLGYAAFNAAIPLEQAVLKEKLWMSLFTGLFLAYQAYFSSDGRRTLGKAALGLRVADLDHHPLELGQALIRSAVYPASSVLGLGFLWALFNKPQQAWHDLAVGSVVLAERRHGTGSRIGAGAIIGALALAVAWNGLWKPRYERTMALSYAAVGMKHVSSLQRMYHSRNGRYATNLLSLATVSSQPGLFLRNMGAIYDLRAGFKIESDGKRFTVVATAKDSRRTQIKFVGS